jgi:hypothetical protein
MSRASCCRSLKRQKLVRGYAYCRAVRENVSMQINKTGCYQFSEPLHSGASAALVPMPWPCLRYILTIAAHPGL